MVYYGRGRRWIEAPMNEADHGMLDNLFSDLAKTKTWIHVA